VGRDQARAAGRLLDSLALPFGCVFTSLLVRSRKTYELLATEINNPALLNGHVIASWRLNERHYGSLVGLSKSEAEEKMGKEKVMGWRRSWNLRPPPMLKHPYYHSIAVDADSTSKPMFDWQSKIWTIPMTLTKKSFGDPEIMSTEDPSLIPLSESLEDTANRVAPLWKDSILPLIVKGINVLVVGHSNTIRACVKHLDNLSELDVRDVTIPSAIPLLYSFVYDEKTKEVKTEGKASSLGMKGRFIVTKELLELNLEASQHLEMSENLDEGQEFKNLLFKTLVQVKKDQSESSAEQKELRPSVMESGWMSFDVDDQIDQKEK